jgi:redox-sensitive bicupin YhaK (pirin superfamily)
MQTLRRAGERGHADHGWLDSFHTFSFANYHDPEHMGFRGLRVINDDTVAPGRGFGAHPHRDMEIISYVLDGALAHRDSMGTGSVIRPGDVQRMSAGTGVVHSELNASATERVHFLQIWLLPSQRGGAPGYEQKAFPDAEKAGRLRLVASPEGRDGSITVHADAALHAGLFGAGETAELPLAPGRHAWVHVARGAVRVNGQDLAAGDGLALSDEALVRIEGKGGPGPGEVLVFDLA